MAAGNLENDQAREPRPLSGGRKRPRWGTLALVVLLHLLALAGLSRVFAPRFTAHAIERATSLVTVTITAPPDPPPTPVPSPQTSQGAAAPQARKETPRAVVAPPAPLPRPKPAPRASSTGNANQSGAAVDGAGTGAGGAGAGTGSGTGGSGGGGTGKAVKIAGDIRSASDYPVPPGGRQARFGQSVTIALTVGIDGRASNCRIVRPSSDPVADRTTCRLATERFRFRPASDADGNPVVAIYGWRQEFFQAR
ncbi:MAG: energy transducer TonB [Croceibacterium sp.]